MAIRVAGFRDGVRPLLVEPRVRVLEKLVDARRRLDVGTVIDEVPDRNAGRQLGQTAHVIAVPVCRHEVIDPREARVVRRGHDAAGVSRCSRSRVSCVDQQGFA